MFPSSIIHASTSLSSAISSDQSFSIGVGHPTNDDSEIELIYLLPSSIQTLIIQLMKLRYLAIANAINTAMTSAVVNDTIESDEIVNASVVSEENGKSRLVNKCSNRIYLSSKFY